MDNVKHEEEGRVYSKDENEGLRSNFAMQDPVADVVEEIAG